MVTQVPEKKTDSNETPKNTKVLSRRDFLKAGAAVATLAAVTATGCTRGRTTTPAQTVTTSPTPTPTVTMSPTPTTSPVFEALQFFDRYQAATIHAAAGRIIPGTPQDPGAKEAGAVIFIDRALEGWDIGLQAQYVAGISGIEAYTQAKHTKGFVDLTDQQQDEILTNMQQNSDEAKKYLPNPTGFFSTLQTHVRQGTFADPIYGGNQGSVGWRLVGHPGIVFARDVAEQKLDASVKKDYMGSTQYYSIHPS